MTCSYRKVFAEMSKSGDQKATILSNALANFDAAAKLLKDEVSPDILEKIRIPRERIELALSPQLDDRQVHVFRAYIVRHSDALGPAKGGIRMTPGVTLDDVTGLAMEMAWKCALIGVPFGGGKSGIVADPEKLTKEDKQKLMRSFARNAHRHIGPQVYVPAPDMGTNEADMGHIKDSISYSLGQATTMGCYVTGKPIILGGIPGRREATGNGVAMCVAAACGVLGKEIKGAKVVVQGFGNVGSVAASTLLEMGAIIVGISDVHGAVYNAKGLN
ncbi:MAG: Glu/Leu/Phe/Val dehydrogenase, partial [Planctomycetaceae bacterium]